MADQVKGLSPIAREPGFFNARVDNPFDDTARGLRQLGDALDPRGSGGLAQMFRARDAALIAEVNREFEVDHARDWQDVVANNPKLKGNNPFLHKRWLNLEGDRDGLKAAQEARIALTTGDLRNAGPDEVNDFLTKFKQERIGDRSEDAAFVAGFAEAFNPIADQLATQTSAARADFIVGESLRALGGAFEATFDEAAQTGDFSTVAAVVADHRQTDTLVGHTTREFEVTLLNTALGWSELPQNLDHADSVLKGLTQVITEPDLKRQLNTAIGSIASQQQKAQRDAWRTLLLRDKINIRDLNLQAARISLMPFGEERDRASADLLVSANRAGVLGASMSDFVDRLKESEELPRLTTMSPVTRRLFLMDARDGLIGTGLIREALMAGNLDDATAQQALAIVEDIQSDGGVLNDHAYRQVRKALRDKHSDVGALGQLIPGPDVEEALLGLDLMVLNLHRTDPSLRDDPAKLLQAVKPLADRVSLGLDALDEAAGRTIGPRPSLGNAPGTFPQLEPQSQGAARVEGLDRAQEVENRRRQRLTSIMRDRAEAVRAASQHPDVDPDYAARRLSEDPTHDPWSSMDIQALLYAPER